MPMMFFSQLQINIFTPRPEALIGGRKNKILFSNLFDSSIEDFDCGFNCRIISDQ